MNIASVSISKAPDSFRIGMRITVKELSKRLGDDIITELNTRRNGPCLTARFDDDKLIICINLDKIDHFDEDTRVERLEERTENYQHKLLEKIKELNCCRDNVF